MIITYTDGTEVNKGSALSAGYFSFYMRSDGTLEVRFNKDWNHCYLDYYEELIIPSEYKGIPVTCVGDFSNVGCKRVVLPDSIKEISEDAFRGCRSLKEVVLSKGITSIGRYAFYECVSLESINLEEGLETIEYGAFGSTEMLTEITIPKSTTKINGRAFISSSLKKAHFLDPDGWTGKNKAVDFSDYASAARILTTSYGYGLSDYFIKKQ